MEFKNEHYMYFIKDEYIIPYHHIMEEKRRKWVISGEILAYKPFLFRKIKLANYIKFIKSSVYSIQYTDTKLIKTYDREFKKIK